MSQVRTAGWYQLAFKHKLQITSDNRKMALLGNKDDMDRFYDELEQELEEEDEGDADYPIGQMVEPYDIERDKEDED